MITEIEQELDALNREDEEWELLCESELHAQLINIPIQASPSPSQLTNIN